MLLRKLIMLAITSGLAKKMYDGWRTQKAKAATPFPTSRRPPEGYARRQNRRKAA